VNNPEIDARIAAYEMAFRMQTSVPELMDVSDEPKEVLEMYGAQPSSCLSCQMAGCPPNRTRSHLA